MKRVFALAAVLCAGIALAGDNASSAAQGYTVEPVTPPSAVTVGSAGKLGVVIKPRAPTWHVHPQAPLKVRFSAPAGLKVERSELSRKDAVDPRADAPRFETAFVATAPGAREVQASVDFFICSDTACVKQVKSVLIPIDVK